MVQIVEVAMQVNVTEAKARLSALVAAAEKGEEVIIARGGRPVARIVPAAGLKPVVPIGLADGVAGELPDFLKPMPEDELELWGI